MINREEVCALLRENNITPALATHALATEAVMTALATHFDEDPLLWGLTGLSHDLDYPQTADNPQLHGKKTAEILAGKLPEAAIDAIKRHNAELNGCEPQTRLDFALRCGETVTGLIHAAALMRPTGYDGMQSRSIRKKMKDKAFAASVNRDIIRECEKINLELDEFLAIAIEAMSKMPGEL